MHGGAPPSTITAGRAGVAAAGSVAQAACAVLLTAAPREKAMAARAAARAWRAGRLAYRFDVAPPDRPASPPEPSLLPPARMPRRGRAGSDRARVALLHALAHIEFVAIDLAFDCAVRFGAGQPRTFVDDWLGVGADEAMHFALLAARLRALGSRYGALPAHAGLWEAAARTRGDLAARLAVVPMALEARGLDVTPATIARLDDAGDRASSAILRRILADEVRHVAVGTRWFEACCAADGVPPAERWAKLLAGRFCGIVKPPFNAAAREAAGIGAAYHAALEAGAAV